MNSLKPEEIANLSLKKARELERLGRSKIRSLSANKILRSALQYYLKAYWVFEERRNEISFVMHDIGRLLHDTYNCPLDFDGKNYIENCPVRLSHINLGFSIGGTESHICSICGKDPLDCEHISGEGYTKILCQNVEGLCNICLKKIGTCRHVLGEFYDGVEKVRIVKDIKPDHIALVPNPSNPFTRITAVPIDSREIERLVSKLPKFQRRKFKYGKTPLFCHHCVECNDYY